MDNLITRSRAALAHPHRLPPRIKSTLCSVNCVVLALSIVTLDSQAQPPQAETPNMADCRPYQPSFTEFKQVLDRARQKLIGTPEVDSVCAFLTPQTLKNPLILYHLWWPESFNEPLSIRLVQRCRTKDQEVHCDSPLSEASLDDLSWISIPADISARQINEFIGLAVQRARLGETIASIDYTPASEHGWSVEDHGYTVVLHREGLKHTRTLHFTRRCEHTSQCKWLVSAPP